MTESTVRIAVTPGAENGVGPELLVASLADYKGSDSCKFYWCGDLASLELGCTRARIRFTVEKNVAMLAHAVPVHLPTSSPRALTAVPLSGTVRSSHGPTKWEHGLLERQARFLELSVELALHGEIDAIVTGPIEKAALAHLAGGPFAGQTEFFAHHLGTNEAPFMGFVGGPFMLTLLTTHMPLRNVSDAIDENRLFEHLTSAAHNAARMQRKSPTDIAITVLGLNPHAGEHGLIGTEELHVFAPAILRAQQSGLTVHGPVAADGFFAYVHCMKQLPDVVVAPYHDQGLCAYKVLSHGAAVNVTCGLSLPRTSPAHGTAVDIAGKCIACASSTKAALKTAIDLARGATP